MYSNGAHLHGVLLNSDSEGYEVFEKLITWIRSFQKIVEDQKQQLATTRAQLEEKEIECIWLRRLNDEARDNSRVEWKNSEDEQVRKCDDTEKLFYEKQYESKLEQRRLLFEKELAQVNTDR